LDLLVCEDLQELIQVSQELQVLREWVGQDLQVRRAQTQVSRDLQDDREQLVLLE
jgi:hypothetical protein